MPSGPLERIYGAYRIVFRKADHVTYGRPTPHVEVWKGNRKLGNYDMASGKVLYKPQTEAPRKIRNAIEDYLENPQVKKKIAQSIEESFFDLSKPAGDYGGIPRGFWVTVSVKFTEDSLASRRD